MAEHRTEEGDGLRNLLGKLQEREQEIASLNAELEATNRGVLALYAELDDKAESLKRADTLKTRFLSDMSHEFRTPVNAILALSRLLDEEPSLSAESRKQVELIRSAAQDLSSLVNDLLDLAKIEAGKATVSAKEFRVSEMFAALRGILRPLNTNTNVALVFEDADALPPMLSDETKIAQILRNFISNALKFTERGEVRVSARLSKDGQTITFAVADTGIGIALTDQERIFEEFTQIDTPMHKRHKGTGLGLPLTRRLASLLGGGVSVTSEERAGSTFFATIPIRYGEPVAAAKPAEQCVAPAPVPAPRAKPPRHARILIIDDDETARYTLGSFVARPGFELREAENGAEGVALAKISPQPDLIFLDLMMPIMGGHEVLERLRADPATSAIPVVVITSRFVNDEEREQILGRANEVIAKGDLSREVINAAIDRALRAK